MKAIIHIRDNLSNVKMLIKNKQIGLDDTQQYFTEKWDGLLFDMCMREEEIIRRMTNEHNIEVRELRRLIEIKNEEVISLRNENLQLGNKITEMYVESHQLREEYESHLLHKKEELIKLQDSFQIISRAKEKVSNEIVALQMQHKAELDGIRSRCKLMSVIDKTEQNRDNNEKVKRYDFERALYVEKAKYEELIQDLKNKHSVEIEKYTSEKGSKDMLIAKLQYQIETIKNEQIDYVCEKNKTAPDVSIDKQYKIEIEKLLLINREKDKCIAKLLEDIHLMKMRLHNYDRSTLELTSQSTFSESICEGKLKCH